MPIQFRCTECNKLLRVGDEIAGRQAKCPECGAVVTVPASDAGGGSGQPEGGAYGFSPEAPAPNPYQTPQQTPGSPMIDTGYSSSGVTRRHYPNYLTQAILCTLFCCLPFGVVAIVFAAQVNGHIASGNYRAAQSSSNNARTWCWLSFWLGLIPFLLYIPFVFIMAAGGGMR